MRRAIVALGVSATLVAGAGAAAYAAGTAAGGNMHDRMTTMDMKSMDMRTMDMGPMPMHGTDMDAMHAQMRDAMPAEMVPACDAAHAAQPTDN